MELIGLFVVFIVGYLLGDLHACKRGGCLLHGKDYKIKVGG